MSPMLHAGDRVVLRAQGVYRLATVIAVLRTRVKVQWENSRGTRTRTVGVTWDADKFGNGVCPNTHCVPLLALSQKMREQWGLPYLTGGHHELET